MLCREYLGHHFMFHHWLQYTLFIQIDAHVLIDAHSLHTQAVGTQKWVKLMISVSKMLGSVINWALYFKLFSLMYLWSDFKPINIYQFHVMHLSSALLFKWIRYIHIRIVLTIDHQFTLLVYLSTLVCLGDLFILELPCSVGQLKIRQNQFKQL